MFKVSEAVQYLKNSGYECEAHYTKDTEITGFCSLFDLKDKSVTWIKKGNTISKEALEGFSELLVVAAEVPECLLEAVSLICHENPKAAFFALLEHFFAKSAEPEIASTAIIKTTKLGKNCSIGEYSVIGEEVELGDDVIIEAHVVISGKVKIGNRCLIHSGCVIGKPGFGYYTGPDGHEHRVPHLGGVQIGHDVEIGANSCVDRGTMNDTVIGNYVKIDNLCHIAHNVVIGDDALIIAGVLTGGSCKIGEGAYIAPGATIKNQTEIGKNAFVGMQTMVGVNVKDNDSVFGVPARSFPREYSV